MGNEEISLDDLQDIEVSPGVDLSEYAGTKATVESVEIVVVPSPYDKEGEYHEKERFDTKVLKVLTNVVTTIKNKEDKDVDIRASELFNLKFEDGKYGVSTSPKAKIRKFLNRQEVDNVKSLKGTEVTVKTYDSDGNTFLGFITS